jgi:hypothetical protein
MREKLYTGMMGGIGSVYNAWRHLVKRVLMGDELAWLSVSGAATPAECLSFFAHARSLHVVGGAQAGHIGMVMDQKSMARLALENDNMMRDFKGLGCQRRRRAPAAPN